MQLSGRAGVPITPLSSQSPGTEGSPRCSVMTKDHSSQQHGQPTSCRGLRLFIMCVFFHVTPRAHTGDCDFPLWLLSQKSLEEQSVPRALGQEVSLPSLARRHPGLLSTARPQPGALIPGGGGAAQSGGWGSHWLTLCLQQDTVRMAWD